MLLYLLCSAKQKPARAPVPVAVRSCVLVQARGCWKCLQTEADKTSFLFSLDDGSRSVWTGVLRQFPVHDESSEREAKIVLLGGAVLEKLLLTPSEVSTTAPKVVVILNCVVTQALRVSEVFAAKARERHRV